MSKHKEGDRPRWRSLKEYLDFQRVWRQANDTQREVRETNARRP